jgi:hypothetical protein
MRHSVRHCATRFGVGNLFRVTQGKSFDQPWALLRNPVGILESGDDVVLLVSVG